MPRIAYINKRFSDESMDVIDQANEIIEDYATQGFDLTLRQLYYQFVARDLIPNTQKSYNRLGYIINDARLAGYVDWDAIVDRTRHLRTTPNWESPAAIVKSCAQQFRYDKWADQPIRVECWIEKDALVGVLEDMCAKEDVPLFSCRGYTSQSAQWRAGQRMLDRVTIDEEADERKKPQATIVLHLGDHDPSGIDMTRDIEARLKLFMGDAAEAIRIERMALNMPQIDQFDPPPNPAKLSDSRAAAYVKKYGNKSYELDALDPVTLNRIVLDRVLQIRKAKLWKRQLKREAQARKELTKIAERMKDDE